MTFFSKSGWSYDHLDSNLQLPVMLIHDHLDSNLQPPVMLIHVSINKSYLCLPIFNKLKTLVTIWH